MWRVVVVMLLGWSSSVMAAEAEPAESFRLSNACLESARAATEDETGMPVVYIRLDDHGGALLHEFTRSRVGRKMRLIDGEGQPLMESAPYIQSPLNKGLMLTGFDSDAQARDAVQRIKHGQGECGPL
ncbi:SecDF P1 head subdomain-containing protein [Alloalcanivorax sp. C16-2]|uniref:SecDF P1 head subdomain-containing protein n=1 Tax=Alloalcanivorax sp. C16-2 TaxID=3390052 RepID=UPI003970C3DC